MDGTRGSLLSGGREPEPADVRAGASAARAPGETEARRGRPTEDEGAATSPAAQDAPLRALPRSGAGGGSSGLEMAGRGLRSADSALAVSVLASRRLSVVRSVGLSSAPPLCSGHTPRARGWPAGSAGPPARRGTAQPRGGTARHTGRRAGVVASVGWPPQELLRHHSPSGQHPRRAGRVWGEAGRLHRAPGPPPKAPGL